MIGQAPDCVRLLELAELSPQPIEHVMLNGLPTEVPVAVLSGHIWSYLNLALTGTAQVVFQNVPSRNGFEAWRRIAQHIRAGQQLRRHGLKKKVENPPQIKRIEDVPLALEA